MSNGNASASCGTRLESNVQSINCVELPNCSAQLFAQGSLQVHIGQPSHSYTLTSHDILPLVEILFHPRLIAPDLGR